MQTWRRKGPLGKLDNIVVYVQRSPQRVAAFLKLSSGKCLVRDNKARWNSWYATIDCAIQERMRLAIDLFCLQRGNDSGADSLSHEDWIVLTDIHRLLSFFHQATLATEGQRATIERILSTMELPLEQLELGKLEYIEGSYIRPCNDSAWTNTMFYQRGLLVLLNQGQLTGCQISSRSGSMQCTKRCLFLSTRTNILGTVKHHPTTSLRM